MTYRVVAIGSMLLGILAVNACQTSSVSSGGLSDGDRTAIRQSDEAFARAANAKDFAAASANYLDDAAILPPNQAAVEGRQAIQKWFAAFPPISNFRLDIVDIDGRGDVAYTRGNYSMTISPPGAAAVSEKGKYVEVWRKQPDGSWKIKWDIFNSDVPAGAPPATPAGKS